MKNENRYNANLLKAEISSLKAARKDKEILIDAQLKEIYDSVHYPVPYIKRQVKELASDKDLRVDLLKIGLNLVVVYLGKKLMKSTSLRDLLLNFLAKRSAKKDEKENEEIPDILGLVKELLSREKDSGL